MKNLIRLTNSIGDDFAIKPSKIATFETLTKEVKEANPKGRCYVMLDNDDADGRLSGMIVSDSFARLTRLTAGAGERITLERVEGIKTSVRPDDILRAFEETKPDGERVTIVITGLVLNTEPPTKIAYAVVDRVADIMEMSGVDDEPEGPEPVAPPPPADLPNIDPAASALAPEEPTGEFAEMVPAVVAVAEQENESNG